ncbi:MAG: hypothetical protein IPP37_14240 [Saprospiraceae bacterium]|nr:hypothetical protein [Saprospiraceae bacterium]
MNSFETSGLKPETLAALKDPGFVTPTPIQQQTLYCSSIPQRPDRPGADRYRKRRLSLPLLQKSYRK